LLNKTSSEESFPGREESDEKKKKIIRLDFDSFDYGLLCDSGLQPGINRRNHIVAEMPDFFCLSNHRKITVYPFIPS
jgi:hypothetical protein